MNPTHHELTAALCHAMASPVRMRALRLLVQGWWTVGLLAQELGESIASTSAHLKVLREAHLVIVEKRGREVWSRVCSMEVVAAISAIQRAAEALLPEYREINGRELQDPLLASELSLSEVASEAERGRILLVDLRPEPEYLAGHLPRAVSQPFSTLETADLGALQRSLPVLAYCRGPWCKRAKAGVILLNERGVPSRRLWGGVVEWQASGLALES